MEGSLEINQVHWKSKWVYSRENADWPSMEVSLSHSSPMHISEEKQMASSKLRSCHHKEEGQGGELTPSGCCNRLRLFRPRAIFRVPVETTRKRGKRTPSSLASMVQTQPNSPHSESQHSGENIIRDNHIIRETSLDVSLLGSGSLPGSIEQPPEPFLFLVNLSVEEPDQNDVPSPTTTISVVHSRSYERVDVEEAVTTAGPSNDQEDSDNIAKTSTMTTHSEDVCLETPFTERNLRCQETMGDGDEEARPKAPSRSKDSTAVDEDRLLLLINKQLRTSLSAADTCSPAEEQICCG
ncbi:hypothetical protein L1987_63821 [Smallanthus sonchifolius]|uniref:Uncharacterized protein n=1 Tax=Smallanthus sonchifolius TaxID=185202 RepID=A0ACB9CEE3_9ASTR|nr:hypothetical protein L1987_63821 [Smallanthus sonchifolius]